MPSVITMVIVYTAAGMPTALTTNVRYLNTATSFQTVLSSMAAGCKAEAYYTDILNGGQEEERDSPAISAVARLALPAMAPSAAGPLNSRLCAQGGPAPISWRARPTRS